MENKIIIKAFPASNGESFLIKCIGEKVTNILIDCGYKSTYESIEKELKSIKSSNESINLLILTHIDNDHISGAREILKMYIDDGIDINEIWYNDYFNIYDLMGRQSVEEIRENGEIITNIIKQKYPPDPQRVEEKDIGYKDANLLVEYTSLEKVKKIINTSLDTRAVYLENDIKCINLNEAVEIFILGPEKENLIALLNGWETYLKEKGYEGEVTDNINIAKAFEIFYINKSKENKVQNDKLIKGIPTKDIINRSSIALIVKFGEKQMLFLGDANPIDYERRLKEFNTNNKKEKTKFDLVKISHHGSVNNTTEKLFDLVTSPRYLIATNGWQHGHPDIETIETIIKNQKEHKTLFFNYKTVKINPLIKSDKLQTDKNFKIRVKNMAAAGKEILEIIIEESSDKNE